VTLTFDLLTLKVVSESRMTWATPLPILVFLGLFSRLRSDVRDSQTSDRQRSDIRQKHRLILPPISITWWWIKIIIINFVTKSGAASQLPLKAQDANQLRRHTVWCVSWSVTA